MIINTLYIVVITLLIATPIGISSAIYLTQYAKQGRLVRAIRFTTEILSGIPSILFGLFGYTVFCVMFRMGTSILAGCLTMTSVSCLPSSAPPRKASSRCPAPTRREPWPWARASCG